MPFVIYQHNGGQFHWRLTGEEGATAAASADSFSTADDGQRAAAEVHRHAGAAPAPQR